VSALNSGLLAAVMKMGAGAGVVVGMGCVGQVVKAGGGRRWQSMGFPLRFLHYLCVFYASLAFGSFVDFFCV
jgi:hypothetical protein